MTESSFRSCFATSSCAVTVLLLVVFCVFTEYNEEEASESHVDHYYPWYTGVAIMIFIGFGFLMTFLKRYSYSAVALNFFTSSLVMVEAILWIGAVQQIFWGESSSWRIKLDLPLLIEAAFCAGSAMIAFGAVIGKTTPTQITWLLILLVPVYALNQHLVFHTLQAVDVGGSISLHVFGAYYGLAASMVLSKQGSGLEHPKNSSNYRSDITSMVGTLFLWLFWPSFNGALATDPAHLAVGFATDGLHGSRRFFCIVNTLLSLLGATLATFTASSALEGKLNMMHIQNATLAGGVAMGSMADLKLHPGAALGVGVLAGLLSTLGFSRIGPFLEARIGLRDTCGVHNLHGMPGVLAGIASAVAVSTSREASRDLLAHGSSQWGYQLAALAATWAIASAAGALAALLVSAFRPAYRLHPSEMFEDAGFWQLAAEDELAGSVVLETAGLMKGGGNSAAGFHDTVKLAGGVADGSGSNADASYRSGIHFSRDTPVRLTGNEGSSRRGGAAAAGSGNGAGTRDGLEGSVTKRPTGNGAHVEEV